MSIADYYEDALLTQFVADVAGILLHVGDPGENCTANVAVENTLQAVTFSAPSGGVTATTIDLDWLAVAANETFSHWSAWDGLVGPGTDNALWFGLIGPPGVPMLLGGDFQIPTGDLTVTLD